MSKHFRVLRWAVALSLGLVALEGVVPPNWLWFAVVPLLPLVAYHLLYLRPRARIALSGAEIDSVYYFGFLVTVATLAAAALQIAAQSTIAILPVLQKFGIGLGATGYAVFARMHLQSLMVQSELKPSDLMDQYATRSLVLLDNLETAIVRMSTFSQTIERETQRVVASSHTALADAVARVATRLDSELRESFDGVKASVEGVRTLVTDTAFAAERAQFQTLVTNSISSAKSANTMLARLAESAKESGDSLSHIDQAARALTRASDELKSALTRLTEGHASLPGIAEDIRHSAEASRVAAEAAKGAVQSVSVLADAVGSSTDAFVALGSSAKNTGERLSRLSEATDGMDAAIAVARESLKSAQSLSAGLLDVGAKLPALGDRAEALSGAFNSLNERMGDTASALERDVARSTRAVNQLAESLTEVAHVIIDRTKQRSHA